MNNKKWEVIGKTSLTCIILSILAKLFFIEMIKLHGSYYMLDAHNTMWAWASLIMSIYLLFITKDFKQLFFGIIIFIIAFFPLLGIFVAIAYFVESYSKIFDYRIHNKGIPNSSPKIINQNDTINNLTIKFKKYLNTRFFIYLGIVSIIFILLANSPIKEPLLSFKEDVNRGSKIIYSAILNKPVTIELGSDRTYIGIFGFINRTGSGKIIYNSGYIYEGQWKAFAKNGRGKMFSPNGTLKYSGDYKNGVKDGFGIYYYDNGKISYKGEWAKDLMHGKGVRYNQDGSVNYIGEFIYGNPK